MLTRLEVSNYALIQKVVLNLEGGLTAITGETGSGKSIILGALNLVLGERADLKLLGNPEKKCLIEATFLISDQFRKWFDELDLDFSRETFLRREINSSGKSRAFINDTPVNLKVLKDLGSRLVEIHSQSENSILSQREFQFSVVDAFANSHSQLEAFREHFKRCNELESELAQLKEENAKAADDLDYHKFLLQEIQTAEIEQINQADLESEVGILENADEVKLNLFGAQQLLDGEQNAVEAIQAAKLRMEKIGSFSNQYDELSQRLESCSIELADIILEIEQLAENVTVDPARAEELKTKLDTLHQLERKHRVEGVAALVGIREDLEAKVKASSSYGERIEEIESELQRELDFCHQQANKLHHSRLSVTSEIEDSIQRRLNELSLSGARIKIDLQKSEQLSDQGIDLIRFLFQANTGGQMHNIGEIASGGEISRVMLAIKAALSEKLQLPTLILDEIDAGVSGEVARQVGSLMKEVSHKLQLVSITHLPQIAGKADKQFKVWKQLEAGKTVTDIKLLNEKERIEELAEMISGKEISEAAIQNARELLDYSQA